MDSEFFLSPTLVTRRKTSFSISQIAHKKKIVKHVQAHIKKSLICSLCRVKAFEEKLNGYNKEVESFRKKEASLNFTIKLILNTLNYYKFIF